jgi:hypothetical protein
MVVTLIELGADLNAQSNRGFTALHGATSRNRKDTILVLLAAGALVDVPAKGSLGGTPLEMGVIYGNADAVTVLLGGGAKTDPESKVKPPLQVAHTLKTRKGPTLEEHGKIEVLLVAAGAKVPPDMQDYVQQPEFVARLAAARDAIAAAKKEIEAARERLAKAGYGGPGAKKPPAAKTTKTISAAQYLTLGLGATMIVGLLVLGYSLGRARRRRLLSSAENMSNEEK